MAASQDEHPLVTLLLAHAADLEVRLEQTGRLSLPLLSTHGFAAAIWQRFYRYPDANVKRAPSSNAIPTAGEPG